MTSVPHHEISATSVPSPRGSFALPLASLALMPSLWRSGFVPAAASLALLADADAILWQESGLLLRLHAPQPLPAQVLLLRRPPQHGRRQRASRHRHKCGCGQDRTRLASVGGSNGYCDPVAALVLLLPRATALVEGHVADGFVGPSKV